MKKNKHLLWTAFYLLVTGLLLYETITYWSFYQSNNKLRLFTYILFCLFFCSRAVSHLRQWYKQDKE